MAARVIKPLECFQSVGTSVCIWLNGISASERPCWQRLWNAASYRMCTDGGANLIFDRVKVGTLESPSMVSGDMDSITEDTYAFLKRRGCEMNHTPDQDKTDLTKCLELLRDRLASSRPFPIVERVLILGGLSGRFDHTLGVINSLVSVDFRTHGVDVFILDGENLTTVLKEGSHSISLDQSMLTSMCGIVPISQTRTTVTTTGFRWNLDNTDMAFGGLISTSNEIASDEVQLSTNAPLVMTVELKKDVTSE